MAKPHRPTRTQRGFTLVEVALSLGITAFALVSIMGMLPIGLSNFRLARQETFYSEMIQTLQSEMDSRSFAALQSSTASIVFYFDGEGNPLPSTTGAVYEITAVPNASYPTGGLNLQLQSTPPNLIYFKFQLIYVPTNSVLRTFPYFVGNTGS